MYALNHVVIKTLQSTASSNVDKAASIVLSEAAQLGLVTNKKDARLAVQQVMKFLYLGKADESGDFKEVSKSFSWTKSSVKPSYFSELEQFMERRVIDHAAIVSVSKLTSRIFYKADLVLFSSDINSCNFSLKLGKSLAEDSTTIYIECDNINRRGVKRLLVLLKEFRNYFDSRVIIILVSGKSINETIAAMSENDFGSTVHESKKLKFENKNERVNIEKKQLGNAESEDMLSEVKKSLQTDLVVKDDLEETVESHRLSLGLEDIVKEKEKLEVELKVSCQENKQIKLEFDKMKLECERETLAKEKENDEICSLKSENHSLKLVNASLNFEREGLEQDHQSLRLSHEEVQLENSSLKQEFDKLKQEYSCLKQEQGSMKQEQGSLMQDHTGLKQDYCSLKQEYDCLKQEHDRLEQEHGRLKEEHSCLKQDHSSLKQDHSSLKQDHSSLKQDHSSLKQDHSTLMEEHESLKEEHDILKQENEFFKAETSLKAESQQMSQAEHLKSHLAESEVNHKSDLKKLCELIQKNQTNMVSSSSPEIIKKSIPKLHFKAVTAKSDDGNVIFSVNIIKGDIIQNYRELMAFEGQGANTKLAKINAFDVLIRNVRNCASKL